MPHVIVKLWPGQPEASVRKLNDQILASVTDTLGYAQDSVSIAFEEVAPQDWMDSVYAADIAAQWHRLTKRPGYGPGPDPRYPLIPEGITP